MLNIYVKNKSKLFFHYNNEIQYYEFEDLEILLDEIIEEYQITSKNMEISLTIDFEEFDIFIDGNKDEFISKEINDSTIIGLRKDKIKEYKKLFSKSKFIIREIKMDLLSIYTSLVKEDKDINQEYLCVGMEKSYLISISKGKISDIKEIEINKNSDPIEDYDFADIRVINETKEDLELVFFGQEENQDLNFYKLKRVINLQFTKSKIIKYMIIYFLVLSLYLLLVNMLDVKELRKKNREKQIKLKEQEQEYMKNSEINLPKDYTKELEKLKSLDDTLKRKEYYSFIKFLIDNSANGIDYISVIYEKNNWRIKGEFTNYKDFQKFEKNLEEKYNDTKFISIKEDDKKSIFEYSIGNKK